MLGISRYIANDSYNISTKTVPNGVCSVIQMITGGLGCPQFLLVYLLSVFYFLTSQCNL